MIKYIITDFDGTLFDTKKANTLSYKEAFNELGYVLNEDQYSAAFGLRFDDMCNALGVTENKMIRDKIKKKKAELYKKNVSFTFLNNKLLEFLKWQRSLGVKIAIASTASRENIESVLAYHSKFDSVFIFDAIIAGDGVLLGKPNPEVYETAMEALGADDPSEVLVFEDTDIGIQAANNAGINAVIKVK